MWMLLADQGKSISKREASGANPLGVQLPLILNGRIDNLQHVDICINYCKSGYTTHTSDLPTQIQGPLRRCTPPHDPCHCPVAPAAVGFSTWDLELCQLEARSKCFFS